MAIRMAATGAADPWTAEEFQYVMKYLQSRADHWRASIKCFDVAVLNLVVATLDEVAPLIVPAQLVTEVAQ